MPKRIIKEMANPSGCPCFLPECERTKAVLWWTCKDSSGARLWLCGGRLEQNRRQHEKRHNKAEGPGWTKWVQASVAPITPSKKSRVIQQLKGCSFIRDQADGEDDSESDSEDESDGELHNSSSGSEENGNMTEISTAAFHAAHMISAPHTPVLGVAMHEARVAGKHRASAQTDSAPSTNNPKPQVKKARRVVVVTPPVSGKTSAHPNGSNSGVGVDGIEAQEQESSHVTPENVWRRETISTAQSSELYGSDGGEEEMDDETRDNLNDPNHKWWPPVRRGRKDEQSLPPRMASSPTFGDKNVLAVTRDLDFMITMTPMKSIISHSNPHPVPASDALCVQSCRHFMIGADKLFKRMANVHKSTLEDQDALLLIEVSGSVERGEEMGHAHCQIALRVRTRRFLKVTKDLLNLLLSAILYQHPDLHNRISVVPRGTQSQLYQLGYAYKDMAEGDLFHAPTPLPESAGHFRHGASPDRFDEADIHYKSYALDMMNKTAYSKGGANRPIRNTGKSKRYPVSKTSYLDIGHDLVEREKFGEDGRRALAVRKIAWLLEEQRHFLSNSWFVPFGKIAVDEEQVAAAELVNNNPFRAQDVSLVRKAMHNYYEIPSHIGISRIAARAPVLLQVNEADDLCLHEMRRWKLDGILPPRVVVRREYPWRYDGAGQAVIVDFNYMYASYDPATDSSLTLARGLGANKFNVNPLLYEVAGDFARDSIAYRSIGIGYMVQTCFALKRLDEVALLDIANYVDYEWNRWCATTLENFEPTIRYRIWKTKNEYDIS